LIPSKPLRAPLRAAGSDSPSWIYNPALDLIVGCGAWSAPLMLLALRWGPVYARQSAVVFYALALAFNYPHYMATIYRAYHTREDFLKYRVFTVHLTLLLALTALLAHVAVPLLPWLFTLYVTWSPWHYTGQNFGLLMMFARRGGAAPTAAERRALYLSFVASYAMLFATFHSGPSNDPLVLSLGLPEALAFWVKILGALAYALLGSFGLSRLIERVGVRRLLAPIALFATQFLWFVLPPLLELTYGLQIPQSRYSTGVLAVMHSAQYLWITSYYAKKEATQSGAAWRAAAYFATMVAGGIALFVPGPWLISLLFRFDFTASFLIFTALVNIHHFMLDGAIWKLRDGRVAALLLDTRVRVASNVSQVGSAFGRVTRWLVGGSRAAHDLRVAVALVLFVWAGLDEIRYVLSVNDANLAGLLRAERLNPYDSAVQMRIAQARSHAGDHDEAIGALERAIAVNPKNPVPQHALAHALIERGRYAEAYEHYHRMLAVLPRDPDALVSLGIVANQLGHSAEAVDCWTKALNVDPGQLNAHLYLAESLDEAKDAAGALAHYQAYVQRAAAKDDLERPVAGQLIAVAIKVAEDYLRLNQPQRARVAFESAVATANQAGDKKLEAAALAGLAGLQEQAGDAVGAARSRQRGLSLAAATDPRSEAADWFDYGQFLRRQGLADRFAYACFLKAEALLRASPVSAVSSESPANGVSPVVRGLRETTEASLDQKTAAQVRQTLAEVLAQAVSLQAAAFRH
jgi:tetratricopeptide (TPR) repeat protein